MTLWQTIWKKLLEAVKGKVEAKKVKVLPPEDKPAQPPAIPASWDAYPCPNWMIHGDGTGENEIRQGAIEGAKATGKTCISFYFRDTGTDLRIWLLEWESDKERGKFHPDNWTRRAQREAGVTCWLVNIGNVSLKLVADTFKAYAPRTNYQVRYTGRQMTSEVMDALGCDIDGIKTTPRLLRK